MKVDESDYFPGKVLNAAIEQAQGDIIVLLNSDAVMLHEECLSNLIAALNAPEVAATFGRQLPRPDADTWVRRDYAASFPDSDEPPEWMSLSLPLAAIRRSVWKQHRFYTNAWASEDTEWGRRVQRYGYRVSYVCSAQVMHSHNYTSRQLYGRRFVEGEADSFIYKRKPRIGVSLLRWCRSFLRESCQHVQVGDVAGLLATPWRLMVYEWAYYRGLMLGVRRQRLGDKDMGVGQKAILSRYG